VKVLGPGELESALEEALRYARKAVLERAVPSAREVEVAVLGNDDPVASVVGEIVPTGHEFYDYAAKYLDAEGADLRIPADLDPAVGERIQRMAVSAFGAIDCAGRARVDFFVEGDGAGEGSVWVNEINTIPGFTSISMYPKLWAASGLAYPELIERLLDLAVERHATERGRSTAARELSS
jgi:D-alanine-D-alanine ligase